MSFFRSIKFLFLLILFFWISVVQGQQIPDNVNVAKGQKYVFTVESPEGWYNDKSMARQFGLDCFFYPPQDTLDDLKNYIYILGVSKKNPEINLDSFIIKDLKKFTDEFPEVTYDTVPVKSGDGIINSKYYSFTNLGDRYREEVLYSEADSSFIIITFTTKGKEDFEAYFPLFKSFVNSFQYQGNDPKAYDQKTE